MVWTYERWRQAETAHAFCTTVGGDALPDGTAVIGADSRKLAGVLWRISHADVKVTATQCTTWSSSGHRGSVDAKGIGEKNHHFEGGSASRVFRGQHLQQCQALSSAHVSLSGVCPGDSLFSLGT
jgi:hypothetical protein